MGINRGEEIHGEVSSAAATTGVAFTYYNQSGKTKSLDSTQVLMVTDFNLVSVPGGAIAILATNGTTTVYLFRGTVAANGGAARSLSSPFAMPRGWTLKALGPTGQIDAQIEGFLTH